MAGSPVDLRPIVARFEIPGEFVTALPYGSGHINDTYAVSTVVAGSPRRYLAQRLNHHVFRKPHFVMENIVAVTNHLRGKAEERGEDPSRHVLGLIPTRDGRSSIEDTEGDTWRFYTFIEDSQGFDVVSSTDDAHQAARAFGRFQSDLADLPTRLHETIPDFHDTPKRVSRWQSVVEADPLGRAAAATDAIEFVQRHVGIADRLLTLHRSGAMPERVTHNDTKLNNVLIDNETGQGICVIDLDTVMPGLALYDFGDLVRTSTCAAPEDETNLNRVVVALPYFEALVRGYLECALGFLLPAEIENLAFAGQLMTFEVGVRFLTDHLEGDAYFRVHREGHNLDRARAQGYSILVIFFSFCCSSYPARSCKDCNW
ncbi:MAG: aminoglycoside phosphotransferase family protein [Planctomycetota bacterium]